MIHHLPFSYRPLDHECDKATNSYLMSVIAVVAGLPFPIVNLIATFFFYYAHRNSTYFVRWHCTQALVSQFLLFFFNSYSFWWTIGVVLGKAGLSNLYISYMLTIIIVNTIEFITTIYTAIQVRKGHHIEWWLCAPISHLICKV